MSHSSLNQPVLSFCVWWRSDVAKMHTAPEKCNIYAKFCNERDPWSIDMCLYNTHIFSSLSSKFPFDNHSNVQSYWSEWMNLSGRGRVIMLNCCPHLSGASVVVWLSLCTLTPVIQGECSVVCNLKKSWWNPILFPLFLFTSDCTRHFSDWSDIYNLLTK